ncbi:hypothetical protein LIA77_06568 [Sarocladium implicatum]|nr:hypothetical protein LIA77_06568 [Sarocladium implicatum]
MDAINRHASSSPGPGIRPLAWILPESVCDLVLCGSAGQKFSYYILLTLSASPARLDPGDQLFLHGGWPSSHPRRPCDCVGVVAGGCHAEVADRSFGSGEEGSHLNVGPFPSP